MRTLLLATCLAVAGCMSHEEYTLRPLPNINRAEVSDNSGHVLHKITDPATLAQIKAFVEERHSGWHEGFPVTAVPSIHILFYDGNAQVGNFGIGGGFFETMLAVGLWVERDATHSEGQHILELVGISEDDLKK